VERRSERRFNKRRDVNGVDRTETLVELNTFLLAVRVDGVGVVVVTSFRQ